MRLSPPDNVAVALRPLKAGETVALDGAMLVIHKNIAVGHKLAARAIAKAELIVKYGCPIGTAIVAIEAGAPLHAANVETCYLPTQALSK
jgi:altronate hydrolase